jgi:hypothetical protein
MGGSIYRRSESDGQDMTRIVASITVAASAIALTGGRLVRDAEPEGDTNFTPRMAAAVPAGGFVKQTARILNYDGLPGEETAPEFRLKANLMALPHSLPISEP